MSNPDLRCTIIEYGTPEYDETISLRYEVLRKPLGMEYDPMDLSREYDQIHIGIYNKEFLLMGCLVLQASDEKRIKMRQVAVSERFQKKGVGAAMVAYSERIAQENNFKTMYCHARDTAVPFYKKMGYAKLGDEFTEVGIPHYQMEKQLV
jgi:predicted GNAT family N-acyltransferase